MEEAIINKVFREQRAQGIEREPTGRALYILQAALIREFEKQRDSEGCGLLSMLVLTRTNEVNQMVEA